MSGTPIGSFELTAGLGRGAMGRVWRAVHRGTGTQVAVKVLLARAAEEEENRVAFRREVRAVARLDHPHIVRVFDYGQVTAEEAGVSRGELSAGCPWLAMELAEGGTLAGRLGVLEWPTSRRILLQLLEGLAHAHARGVVHRDIKPQNVLFSGTRGRVLLADFGIAQALLGEESPHEQEGDLLGTMSWIAPEQIENQWRDQGPWTDLYSLGCVAWTMAAGRPPFGTGRTALWGHLSRPLPPLDPDAPVVPGFEELLRRLTAKDAGDRLQSAADAIRLLSALEGEARALPSDDWDEADPTVYMGPLVAREVTGPQPADLQPSRALPEECPRPKSRGETARLLGTGLGLVGLRQIPMVDREQEREALWRALREAWEGDCTRVIVLRGSVGSGKSRLAAWISESAHEHAGAQVLTATHSMSGGPMDGVGPMLSSHLRCSGLDQEAIAARVLEKLAPSSREERYDARALAWLAGGGEPGEASFSGPRERHLLVARYLAALARERSVVLRLEDVQWGADLLGLVDTLAAEDIAGVLIVLTVQEETLQERDLESRLLEELSAHAAVRVLELGPLPEAYRRQLVEELLGLEGWLAAQVSERTGGNPLFAVQLLGDWVQRRWLIPGPRGFELQDGVVPELPEGLAQVCATRVGRLLEGRPPEHQVALELAAVLGLDVDTSEWAPG